MKSVTRCVFYPLLVLLACDVDDDTLMGESAGASIVRTPWDEDEVALDGDESEESTHEFTPEEAGAGITARPEPSASGCHYKVVWPAAGVYEKPGWNKVKTKYAGDIVGEYCNTWWDGTHEWQMVACASTNDNIGWMRRDALVWVY